MKTELKAGSRNSKRAGSGHFELARTTNRSGKAMLPQGRKAISPLVATVLLLAFAVAIGTMVVSLLADSLKTKPCDNVGIALEGATACFKKDQITFITSNTGKKPLANLKVRLINENSKDISEPQLATAIDVGSAAKVSFPYQSISYQTVEVTVIPVVQGKETPEYCAQAQIKFRIADC